MKAPYWFLALNLFWCVVALLAALALYISSAGAASRYAELDRRSCLNQAALDAFFAGRLDANDRMAVARWISRPVYKAGMGCAVALGVGALGNLLLVAVCFRPPPRPRVASKNLDPAGASPNPRA